MIQYLVVIIMDSLEDITFTDVEVVYHEEEGKGTTFLLPEDCGSNPLVHDELVLHISPCANTGVLLWVTAEAKKLTTFAIWQITISLYEPASVSAFYFFCCAATSA